MNTPGSTFLIAGLAAAVILSGCSRSSAAQSSVIAAQPPAIESPVNSARPITISGDDTMKFSVTEIYARPGESLAVTLTNRGSVPKAAMAHNWVLLQPGVDLNLFVQAAVTAVATNYVPASYRSDVLAETALVGPMESQTTVFAAPQTPGRYPFICTFPGHMQAGMKGYLVVE